MDYSEVFESVPDAILITDRGGRITATNSSAEQMFGYSRLELIGQPIEILIPVRLRGDHRSQRQAYESNPHGRAMGSGVRIVALRRDGTEFPVDISLRPMGDRGVIAASATSRSRGGWSPSCAP